MWKDQWKLYQCESHGNVTVDEVLPETLKSAKETSKVSYEENALKAFGLNAPTKLPKQECIDTCWEKIGSIKDDSGHLKYLQLFSLIKCVLSISHGNSIPERGFSINKHLLDIHGNSTQNDNNSIKNGQGLHIKCWKNYDCIYKQAVPFINFSQLGNITIAKRKQNEREQLKVNKEKEALNLNEKVNLINAEIKLKESGLTVADDWISEGNQELQNELTSSKMSKEKL